MWNIKSLRHRIFKIHPRVSYTCLLLWRLFHAPKRDAEWNKLWLTEPFDRHVKQPHVRAMANECSHIFQGPYLSSFSKCHFSLTCWEFMKCTPSFKLKHKSKLPNFLKLRITLTLSYLRQLESSLKWLGVASRGLWWRWGDRDMRCANLSGEDSEEECSWIVWRRALNQMVTFSQTKGPYTPGRISAHVIRQRFSTRLLCSHPSDFRWRWAEWTCKFIPWH